MKGPIGKEFIKKYEAKGFKVLGFIIYGARHVIAKEPIRKPADVRGKKMRVLQSQLHINLWKSLGANPTPVPITEAYNALKAGVVDYMDMTMSGYHALKLYEVVPQFSQTGHIWALGAMYVSKRFWDSLTKEQQAVFQKTADQVIPFFNEMAAYEQGQALAAAVKKGAKVIQPDKAAWQKAMAGFWKSYAPKVGGMAKINAVVNTGK
jgi:TRAP-type C4-dicarboxylate transport system substrate-binding protein